MSTNDPLLTQRAVVLCGLEDEYGTAATLTQADNAMLASDPEYTVDPQKIERKFSHPDLSPYPFQMGRITGQAKFTCELRGNSLDGSSDTDEAPLVAVLMQACGFTLTSASSAEERTSVFPDADNTGAATWAISGTPTNVAPVVFTLECTTAGASSDAVFSMTSNNTDLLSEDETDLAASDGFTLGTTGVTATPTSTTDFVVGDKITISVMPEGVCLTPISSDVSSATIEMYFDGVMHKLTGAYGTFSFSAKAGELVNVEFTFSGKHNTVVDEELPDDPQYEDTLPPIFENAMLTWGENANLVAETVSFDLGAKSEVREDANQDLGYSGYRFTERAPSGSINPESVLVASEDIWGQFENAKQVYMFARGGTEAGNQIIIECPRTQQSTLKYADRSDIRTNDMSLSFARLNGNDEVRFFFC